MDSASSPSRHLGGPDSIGSDSEQLLWARARRGSRSAAGEFFTRNASWLRRWARGRLPRWARAGIDTSDLVQDALHRTLARIESIRLAQAGAMRIYLRRAIENRITDQMRRATVRRKFAGREEAIRLSDEAAPQYQQVLDDETWGRYLKGLKRLTPRHQRLVVGRVEFGYSYKQLALMERLSTPDAARMAFRRALARLSDVMPDA